MNLVGALLGGFVPVSVVFLVCRAMLGRRFSHVHANAIAGLVAWFVCGGVSSYVVGLGPMDDVEAVRAELWLAYMVDAVVVVSVGILWRPRETPRDDSRADENSDDETDTSAERDAMPDALRKQSRGPSDEMTTGGTGRRRDTSERGARARDPGVVSDGGQRAGWAAWVAWVALALSVLSTLLALGGADEARLRREIAHAQNEADLARRRVEALEDALQREQAMREDLEGDLEARIERLERARRR